MTATGNDGLQNFFVIPEGRSRESVVSFAPLFRNDGSPTETLGDDGNKTQQKRLL